MKQLIYDDTVSEDRLSSTPQLDWEQEGERTGSRLRGLNSSKSEQETDRHTSYGRSL